MKHFDPNATKSSAPDKGPFPPAVVMAAVSTAPAYFDQGDEQAPDPEPVWWTAHVRAS